jgi:hypothetical protein
MMASTNTTNNLVPIYNLPDLKKVEDDEITFAIYDIVLGTKAHIPVPKQETVSFCCFYNVTLNHFLLHFILYSFYLFL